MMEGSCLRFRKSANHTGRRRCLKTSPSRSTAKTASAWSAPMARANPPCFRSSPIRIPGRRHHPFREKCPCRPFAPGNRPGGRGDGSGTAHRHHAGNRGIARKIKAWDSAHPSELDHHDNIHARYDQLGGYQLEPKAKQILAGLEFPREGFPPAPARDERRLGHARPPGPAAGAGAGPVDAGRADQPPGPGIAAVVPGIPAQLSRRHPPDFARPRFSQRACRRISWKSASAS